MINSLKPIDTIDSIVSNTRQRCLDFKMLVEQRGQDDAFLFLQQEFPSLTRDVLNEMLDLARNPLSTDREFWSVFFAIWEKCNRNS